MDRFYAPRAAGADAFDLDQEETHHLARVLRKVVGDVVEVFDGAGSVVMAEVVQLTKRSCSLRTIVPWSSSPPATREVVIAASLPKGDRARFLVEKLTELGVHRLVPLLTDRTVVTPRDAKIDKLRQTVVAACKQCGRNELMAVAPPHPWAELLKAAGSNLIVGDPSGASDWLVGAAEAVWVAVGPEGGLTEAERQAAESAGARFASLGRHVLRIETAAVAAAVRTVE